MEKKYQIKDVAASITGGAVGSRGVLCILHIGNISVLLMTPIVIFSGILYDSSIFWLLLLPIIVAPVFFYFTIRVYKLRTKIKLWLEDAIECNVQSKRIDTTGPSVIFAANTIVPMRRMCKIQIQFGYNGKKIKKISDYARIFGFYADREISILYSEKYNQVLILKDGGMTKEELMKSVEQ